ncbi:MAG: hypothetical protein A2X12_11190 [Bacteroidetes bacterium GWE2_29_8]|nr:MAG: hypothetical protein A2X12_11190 [Bacteroidetes bacterium GWE2_29_8]OFY22344.1 MAG: hypothetical protein A2X02_07670 [Bacteroidetes bacterium GWF2_29_10]
MYIKLQIITLLLFGFIACNNHSEKIVNKATDTTNVYVNPEIEKISQLILEQPDNSILYEKRALFYLNENNANEALKDIRKAIIKDSSNYSFFRTLSDIYFVMGLGARSKEALKKSISLRKDNDTTYINMAEIFFYEKDFKNALLYLDTSFKINKCNSKYYLLRGLIAIDKKDSLKAITFLTDATKYNENNYDAFLQLGLLYSSLKNEKAISNFEKAIKLNPSEIEADYALALFHQENQKFEEAIVIYNKIIKKKPNYKYAYYNIGYIKLVYQNAPKDAVKYFTEAITIDKNYVEAYYNRGYSYELISDYNNAEKDYKKALELKHNYEKAIEALNRLYKD